MSREFAELEKKLGYGFRNPELLRRALSHKSYVNENKVVKGDYENLEFLGDAVLEFIVSDILIKTHTTWNEGELSKLRGNIVDSRNLAESAIELELGEYMLLGAGEEKTGGRDRPSLLADVLEAVIAAVYLDGGIRPARKMIRALFLKQIKDARKQGIDERNYKSRLQEIIQEKGGKVPSYIVVEELGPDHDKEFVVSLKLKNEFYTGRGKTKQSAEQDAARKALAELDI